MIIRHGDGGTLRFLLTQQWPDLPVDRTQWNALVEASPGSTVFQTYEWAEAWWASFGGTRKLHVVTLWDGQSLVGIAPLMTQRRRGLRQVEFIGSPNADYQDFILGGRAEELLPLLACHLMQHRQDWDMLVLRNVPTHSSTFATLPSVLRAHGIASTDHERVLCPALEIASRPAEVRRMLDSYSLRRRVKQLQSVGELSFTRCTTKAQVDHYLPQFFTQYVERHHGALAARVFSRPDVRSFYVALAKSMLPPGWLHLSVLECAGQPVAFHFGFAYAGRMYWYKPCFDPRLARLSPGTVLLSNLIRDTLESGLQELDFTVGAEAFKYRYANIERVNANLRVFSRRWLYLGALGFSAARRVARLTRRQFHDRFATASSLLPRRRA